MIDCTLWHPYRKEIVIKRLVGTGVMEEAWWKCQAGWFTCCRARPALIEFLLVGVTCADCQFGVVSKPASQTWINVATVSLAGVDWELLTGLGVHTVYFHTSHQSVSLTALQKNTDKLRMNLLNVSQKCVLVAHCVLEVFGVVQYYFPSFRLDFAGNLFVSLETITWCFSSRGGRFHWCTFATMETWLRLSGTTGQCRVVIEWWMI